MNEWMNECIAIMSNHILNIEMMHIIVDSHMNECMNEWMNEYINEWMGEWILNKWVNEWMHEWINYSEL